MSTVSILSTVCGVDIGRFSEGWNHQVAVAEQEGEEYQSREVIASLAALQDQSLLELARTLANGTILAGYARHKRCWMVKHDVLLSLGGGTET